MNGEASSCLAMSLGHALSAGRHPSGCRFVGTISPAGPADGAVGREGTGSGMMGVTWGERC